MQGKVVTIGPLSTFKAEETTTIRNLSHIHAGIILAPMKFRINLTRNNLNF